MSTDGTIRSFSKRTAKESLPAVAKERTDRAVKIGFVILGMHRSGTSALARVMNILGCDLPKTVMGISQANMLGHWESQVISDFDDMLLESAGSNWQDWLPFNPSWYRSPKADEYKEKALTLLADEYGTSHLFVFKDRSTACYNHPGT
jgi:hypothetical protein